MKASEVSKIIDREINGNWSLSNMHGVDLKRCLVPPCKQVYDNSCQKGETLELWLVLEEIPENRSGYKIVFDEEFQMFGLAVSGSGSRGHDIFIGLYGTFLETLAGM